MTDTVWAVDAQKLVDLAGKFADLKAQNGEMLDLLKGCDYIFRQGVPVSNQSTLARDIRALLSRIDGAQ